MFHVSLVPTAPRAARPRSATPGSRTVGEKGRDGYHRWKEALLARSKAASQARTTSGVERRHSSFVTSGTTSASNAQMQAAPRTAAADGDTPRVVSTPRQRPSSAHTPREGQRPASAAAALGGSGAGYLRRAQGRSTKEISERVRATECLLDEMRFREAIDAAHALLPDVPADEAELATSLRFCIARGHLFLGQFDLARAAYKSLGASSAPNAMMRVAEEERCVVLMEQYVMCSSEGGDARRALRAISVVCDVFSAASPGLAVTAECMRCTALMAIDPVGALALAHTITARRPVSSLGWLLHARCLIACALHTDNVGEALRSAARAVELEPHSLRCQAQHRACESLHRLLLQSASDLAVGAFGKALSALDQCLALSDAEILVTFVNLTRVRVQLAARNFDSAAALLKSVADTLSASDVLRDTDPGTILAAEAALLQSRLEAARPQNREGGESADIAVRLAERALAHAARASSALQSRASALKQEVEAWLQALLHQHQHRHQSQRRNVGSGRGGTASSHYDVLGVARSATRIEVVRAYRRLALQWHPDKWCGAPGGLRVRAESEFKRLAEAYDTLANPERRAAYDHRNPSCV